MTDNVNHPAHYENGPFECIELTQLYSFCIGNAIKYVWRHQQKGKPLEDLKKALWYLDRAIENHEYMQSYEPGPIAWKYERLQREPNIGWERFWMFAKLGMLPEMRKSVQHHINLLEEGTNL